MTGATRPFLHPSRILFVDTDASGRIHYSAIFRHFEAAETEFLRALGHPYTDFEARDVGFPRVHVEASFHAPLRFDDLIEIEVSVTHVGQRSFSLSFAALCRGVKAASGKLTVVTMSKQTQRACPLPEPFAQLLRSRL